MSKVYSGRRWAAGVEVWGTVYENGQSHYTRQYIVTHIVHHSPTGIEWGYGGSGPADLALSLLCDLGLPKRVALRLHQCFKADVVAHLDRACWTLSGQAIAQWISIHAVRWHSDSPDAGDPACTCSLCGELIAEDDAPALRWTDLEANIEARFHRECGLPLMEALQ